MRLCLSLPFVLSALAAGCACAPPTVPPTDAGPTDGGAGLRPLDADDRFAVPDASGAAGPACTEVERLTTALPPLEEGQIVVQGFGDRLLLVERPNNPPPPDYTSILRFYSARRGEPFELLAEHAFGSNVGFVQHVRFRDGAWDVIVDRFAHEGTITWLRVGEDGAIEATEHRGPGVPRLEIHEVFPSGPDYVLLALDMTDGARSHPVWILRATADPAGDEAVLLAPPGVLRRQVLAQPERGRVLLLEHDPVVGRPPRIAVVPLAPLSAPTAEDFTEIELPYEPGLFVHAYLFATPSGLVLGEFAHQPIDPAWLRLAWLDDAFGVTASLRIDTVVGGAVAVAGAFPAQEIVVTLPDSPSLESGPATVFHARASAPGVVSALTPIGRALAVFPPELVVGPDGRVGVLHFLDRLDLETLCEAP